MNKPRLYILCYNAVLDIAINNYSLETFEIFCDFLKTDFAIEIDSRQLKLFFDDNFKSSKDEGILLRDYFLINNLTDKTAAVFDEILYKLRVADRNEIRIDRELKNILQRLNNSYLLVLVCNANKQFADRELKLFKLTDYFTEIIYIPPIVKTDANFNANQYSELAGKQIITSFEQLSVL